VAGLVFLVVGLVGCGGSDSGSDSGSGSGGTSTTAASSGGGEDPYIAKAQARVDEHTKAVTEWPGPTEAPAPAKDKLVVIVPCDASAEGCARGATGAKEAAEAIGWRTKTINGQGTPRVYNEAISQAIELKAAAVILPAVAGKLISEGLEKAKKAGVFIVTTHAGNQAGDGDVDVDVSMDGLEAGRALGDYAVVKTKGEATVIMVTGREFPVTADWEKGSLESFEACAKCEVKEQADILVTDIPTRLPGITQGMLQANPDVNWVWAPYDYAAQYMIEAIVSAGAAERVQMSGADGNDLNLQFIREGRVQAASLGYPIEWANWAAIDQVNRLLNGEEPVDAGVPFKLFIKENLPPKGKPWQGDLDFRAEYRKLWGLEG
jgi:ribose transport system substrate-binding protein